MNQRSLTAYLSTMMLVAISAVLLARCQSPSLSEQPAPTLPPHAEPTPLAAWTQAWLTSDPCRAPCWYGITPGKTLNADAFAILQSLPFVDQGSVQEFDTGTEQRWTWRWKEPIQGLGELRRGEERIQQIGLTVDEVVPLDAMIAHLGPPQVRTAKFRWDENEPWTYSIALWWPTSRITMSGGIDHTPPRLEPHTMLGNSIVLHPAREGEPPPQHPWLGYYSYQYYDQFEK